ncbi:hypothetical protein BH11BAC1_BH11BAC1_07390 [soil metagenome]
MKTLLLLFSMLVITITGHAQALLRETIFKTMKGKGEAKIHQVDLAVGMYFFNIDAGKELIAKGKFVID